ncbi:MaoC family dehydratase [Methylobacterium sp. SyP6R]|uniref:MaoC family dehydratase n=1 Tax=Methylobacterium sp. SyP6R TaxID=2718876 RepID=UPI001F46580D|nr:MaoC family dehydratase [Methylobacterium sp. SyP6R]MCF4125813.1 MaoC family dehydratase [Methylobacterium sp. SyP6R]
MTRDLYLEDLAPGQVYGSGAATVTEADIVRFATEFDPQPFHLDAGQAASTFFGGLAASGWHTAALTMQLLVGSELRLAGGIIGAGMDELRWPKPLRPGDTIRLTSEVIELRPSRSRPSQGLAKVRTTTLNQHGEPVQVLVANLLVVRRPEG